MLNLNCWCDVPVQFARACLEYCEQFFAGSCLALLSVHHGLHRRQSAEIPHQSNAVASAVLSSDEAAAPIFSYGSATRQEVPPIHI